MVAELKLKNTSPVAVVVDKNALYSENVTVIIAGDRREPRQLMPYARHCFLAEPCVLQPGESLYAPLFLSAGVSGFDLAEPGRYTVYAALRTPAGDVLSTPLRVEVRPPATRDQERLAPDVFTEQVGRVLALGGSRVLADANGLLREVVERLPESALGVHAAAALGRVEAVPGRVLVAGPQQRAIELTAARPDEALPMVEHAYGNLDKAAETLGHIRGTEAVEQTAKALASAGERPEAAQLADHLAGALGERGVLPSVVRRVQETAAALST